MGFNYNKLRGRIIEKFGTQIKFAKAMGWSERTLSLKLHCKRSWTQTDILKAMKLLNISQDEISIYFFDRKVQNNEL